MATIIPTKLDVSEKGDGSTWQFIWTPCTENDTCAPVQMPQFADRAIQVAAAPAGAFGSATIKCSGSIDGINYVPLNDPTGTAIAIQSAAIKQVLENSVLTQPTFTGGSGQSVTISMIFKLSNPLRT